jgi:hypothetical protein
MNPKVSNVQIVFDNECDNVDKNSVIEALKSLITKIEVNGLCDMAIYHKDGKSIGCMEVDVPKN